mgnify:CR=1 FL=1
MIFSMTLWVPVLVSLIFNDGEVLTFLESQGLIFAVGFCIWLPTIKATKELSTQDGFLITALFWLVLGVLGSVPFLVSNHIDISLVDAIFESMSGLTTTGATVITGLDYLPESLLFYRQFLQWLGGIGIVVIAVAILPMLGVGGMQLYQAETPGPVKDSKMKPRITETAKALFTLYCSLTLVCAGSYWFAGMTPFDAICHAFSTIAIGGFSTHDASMGYFQNPAIWMLASAFMLIAGINFSLHYLVWHGRKMTPYFRDDETRFYVGMLVAFSLFIAGSLYVSSYYSVSNSVLHGIFQTISIGTTTGFATTNFSIWPTFIPMLLIMLSFMGGCAGSTGGGVKAVRALLMFRQGRRELAQLVHPRAIIPLKLGAQRVPATVVSAVWSFVGIYILALIGISLFLQGTGLDFLTAFSATAASLNNLGPGLGDVSAHYQNISSTAKLALCFAMLLGRLEVFTLLVLFTPTFWRR